MSQKSTPKDKGGTASLGNICVYCGSGGGRDPIYGEAADLLGQDLAEAGLGLVYGGGGLGLMGKVARSTRDHGGRVTGIMPDFLSEREKQMSGLDELVIVGNMHERKMMMFERSDAFVALPGGIGTLEELVEQLTWAQLGRHAKPVVVANIGGFWSPFLALLAHMREETFIRDGLEVRFAVVDEPRDIVPTVKALMAGHVDADTSEVIAKF